MGEEKTWTVVNVLMAVGTCFVILLSICEILAPVVVAIITGVILSEEMSNPILEQHGTISISTIGLLVSSIGLFITYFFQWWKPFKTLICSIRHLFNICFTIFAIWHLINMKEANQVNLIESVAEKWNDFTPAQSFESENACSGYVSCQIKFIKSVDKVYTYGRNLTPVIGIFWAAIIFFGLISTGAVLISRFVKF